MLEQQKNGISKENEDLRSSWKSGEKSRLEAETELQNLQRQTNALRSERLKLGTDVTHLQHRVARDKERWQECCRSMLELKEKVTIFISYTPFCHLCLCQYFVLLGGCVCFLLMKNCLLTMFFW